MDVWLRIVNRLFLTIRDYSLLEFEQRTVSVAVIELDGQLAADVFLVLLRLPSVAMLIGVLIVAEAAVPCQIIGHRHTEGLPAGFLPELFILRTGCGVCHRLLCVVDRLGEALSVCLLRLAPLDPGHIRGLHDGLLTVGPAVGQFSDRAFDLFEGCLEFYFGHLILAFTLYCA